MNNEKLINPPLIIPKDAIFQPFTIKPGTVCYVYITPANLKRRKRIEAAKRGWVTRRKNQE